MNELKRRRPPEEEETDSREGKEEVGPSLKGIFTLFVVSAIRNPKPNRIMTWFLTTLCMQPCLFPELCFKAPFCFCLHDVSVFQFSLFSPRLSPVFPVPSSHVRNVQVRPGLLSFGQFLNRHNFVCVAFRAPHVDKLDE